MLSFTSFSSMEIPLIGLLRGLKGRWGRRFSLMIGSQCTRSLLVPLIGERWDGLSIFPRALVCGSEEEMNEQAILLQSEHS